MTSRAIKAVMLFLLLVVFPSHLVLATAAATDNHQAPSQCNNEATSASHLQFYNDVFQQLRFHFQELFHSSEPSWLESLRTFEWNKIFINSTPESNRKTFINSWRRIWQSPPAPTAELSDLEWKKIMIDSIQETSKVIVDPFNVFWKRTPDADDIPEFNWRNIFMQSTASAGTPKSKCIKSANRQNKVQINPGDSAESPNSEWKKNFIDSIRIWFERAVVIFFKVGLPLKYFPPFILLCLLHLYGLWKQMSPFGCNCSICMEEEVSWISAINSRVHLQCGHVFHSHCLNPWMIRGYTNCPLCRQPLARLPNNEFVDFLLEAGILLFLFILRLLFPCMILTGLSVVPMIDYVVNLAQSEHRKNLWRMISMSR
jgi:hypothetical protein